MSGSTVALQWLYSGSTVALQWVYSGSTMDNKRPNDEENLPLTHTQLSLASSKGGTKAT
nr:hypothetical protein [uncultured Capnocytophaga sp.]